MDARFDMETKIGTAPTCPGCCRPMRLVRLEPRVSGNGVQTFECRPCGVVCTQADSHRAHL
jgi:transposase-like protein